MDRELLVKMLNELPANERRAITYMAKGGHRCEDSTSLIKCCNVSRCQACHIPHLKEKHDAIMLHAYEKFSQAGALTWKGREYKKPLQPKANKKTRKVSAQPRAADPRVSITDQVPDDQLEAVLAMIAAKLGRNG
jgi:hypothetical protein